MASGRSSGIPRAANCSSIGRPFSFATVHLLDARNRQQFAKRFTGAPEPVVRRLSAEVQGFGGFFIILNAADDDGDGLSNGYESWFNYNGQKTMISRADSDDDLMFDGWEVTYGVNPTSLTGADGGAGNPDADAYSNVQEYNNNILFAASSYDPLKPYGSTQQGQRARPVVSISTANLDVYKLGGTATFKIQRSIGLGADVYKGVCTDLPPALKK